MIHADMLTWLDSEDAEKCVLVELSVNNGTTEIPMYFSTRSYVTTSADTPANTIYLPLISDVGAITESLSIAGETSLTFGEISLDNTEGDLDDLLMYICTNRSVKVLIGDISWPKADFRTIYNGVIEDIIPKGRTQFSIVMTDMLQLLNGPVSETVVADRDNAFSPVCFGEVSNVTPLLVDPNTLTYAVHTQNIGGLIEVRDAGVPTEFINNADGTFTLVSNPYGEVCCSVWGHLGSGYSDTIADTIQSLVTEFGTSNRLALSDIDTANFAAFAANNQQTVGIYHSSRQNMIATINSLANSVGAGVATSKTGQLRIHQIVDPALATALITVSQDDLVEGSMTISSRINPLPSFKLAYNQNYSPDGTIASGIPARDKALLIESWKHKQVANSEVISAYRLFDEPTVKETALQVGTEAEAEAARWLALFNTPRFLLRFTGFTKTLCIELGDVIELSSTPVAVGVARNALVLEVVSDWVNGTTTMEVLI